MDATTRKTRFADHFTVADAGALIGCETMGDREGTALMESLMAKALRDFLIALQAEGALPEIPGTKGHDLRFAEAWNRIARAQGTDEDFDEVAGEMGIRMALQGTMPGDKSVATAETAHAAICAFADRGRDYVRAGDSAVTGETVYVNVADWMPTAKAYANRISRPLTDAEPIGHQIGEITLPTGNLLISDWFRCDGFGEALEEGEPDISLNCDAGIVASTLHKLTKGVASFHIGNSSPSIFLRDGALIIGQDRAFEEHDWDANPDGIDPRALEGRAGEVCTDYWGATIVDQKTLMDLLEAQLGSAEAAFDAYAEYRRTTFDRITEAKVEPGTYEVHFGPRYADFAKAFRHASVPALDEIAAYGVLIPKRH